MLFRNRRIGRDQLFVFVNFLTNGSSLRRMSELESCNAHSSYRGKVSVNGFAMSDSVSELVSQHLPGKSNTCALLLLSSACSSHNPLLFSSSDLHRAVSRDIEGIEAGMARRQVSVPMARL